LEGLRVRLLLMSGSDRQSGSRRGRRLPPPSKTVTDSNWSYTKEERAAAKTKANEKDVWNLEFLERVQNKTYASGTEKDPQKKKRMMQEYDAFLKDPINYRPPRGDEE
ncbi:MAG: hypothetical protein IIZ42_02280, partial [Eubacterium sp.]|nr:hypothetical protein [Eubacterium sp.]